MAIALYHVERCPYSEKVRLALELEGLPYESLAVEDEDRAEVRRISGQESVPVLVDEDGTVRVGSAPILAHLAGAEGSRLLPTDRRDRALAGMLVDRADRVLAELTRPLRRGIDAEGRPLGEEERHQARRRLGDELTRWDDLLGASPYFFGERPSVADVATHAFLNRIPDDERAPLTEAFERLDTWFHRIYAVAGREPR